jgi:hypothetical protein
MSAVRLRAYSVVGETTVAVLWVRCTTCRRTVIVRDLPERPPTG